jgi:hypothetical protein
MRWWMKKYKLPPNHPLLLDRSIESLLAEQMDDMFEDYIIENNIESGDIESIDFFDVFPDLDDCSFPALLKRAVEKLKEGEDFEDAYNKARAQEAQLKKSGKT